MCNYTITLYQHCAHRAFAATICPHSVAIGAPCYAYRGPKSASSDIVVDGECEKCSGEMCTDGGCVWKLREAKDGGGGLEAKVVGKAVRVVEDADKVDQGREIEGKLYDDGDADFAPKKLTRAMRLGAVMRTEEGKGPEGSGKGKGKGGHHHWHLPERAK